MPDDESAPSAERREGGPEWVAIRLRLLDIDPSGVRDNPGAAAECGCACHPRPGGDTHHGGVCPCQWTPDERKSERAAAFASLDAIRDQYAAISQANLSALAEAAAELGAEVDEVYDLPGEFGGVVDGERFVARERDGAYLIAITGPLGDRTLWQAHGRGEPFPLDPGSYERLLRAVVGAVRTSARQARCGHPARSHRFCPDCGLALIDPALPGDVHPARSAGP